MRTRQLIRKSSPRGGRSSRNTPKRQSGLFSSPGRRDAESKPKNLHDPGDSAARHCYTQTNIGAFLHRRGAGAPRQDPRTSAAARRCYTRTTTGSFFIAVAPERRDKTPRQTLETLRDSGVSAARRYYSQTDIGVFFSGARDAETQPKNPPRSRRLDGAAFILADDNRGFFHRRRTGTPGQNPRILRDPGDHCRRRWRRNIQRNPSANASTAGNSRSSDTPNDTAPMPPLPSLMLTTATEVATMIATTVITAAANPTNALLNQIIYR